MYTLEFENVTKRYGHAVVVRDVTFPVQPGRVTEFMGPNGAGKSTTMKVLLDLAKADHGRATIAGTRYRDMVAPARHVGVVLEPNAPGDRPAQTPPPVPCRPVQPSRPGPWALPGSVAGP